MVKNNLLKGKPFWVLLKLALPIMATSFIQMAYNLTDMMWIGRLGTTEVAAVGTIGFFTWLSMAFILIPGTAASVRVPQFLGANKDEKVKYYIGNTLMIAIVFGLVYSSVLLFFKNEVISFFRYDDILVNKLSVVYLSIIAIGIPFTFVNPVLTNILIGHGDSKIPFKINTFGLLMNIILDPVLIFGIGNFDGMGVKGAAIATILSQLSVTVTYIVYLKVIRKDIFNFKLHKLIKIWCIKDIIRIGLPTGVQSGFFTIIAIFIARIIAGFGSEAVAIQRVGTQIEAISWMTAHGFSDALSAFVAQNYGAKKYERLKVGVISAILTMSGFGLLTSIAMVSVPELWFRIFISDKNVLQLGISYLKIIGLSQLFMCLEITITGAFNGLGKTLPPSITSICFTSLRIPLAIILITLFDMGLNGVWWSISITSTLKGTILLSLFFFIQKKSVSANSK